MCKCCEKSPGTVSDLVNGGARMQALPFSIPQAILSPLKDFCKEKNIFIPQRCTQLRYRRGFKVDKYDEIGVKPYNDHKF